MFARRRMDDDSPPLSSRFDPSYAEAVAFEPSSDF
jgi:hypothetical protein